jgi:hypothetical protein
LNKYLYVLGSPLEYFDIDGANALAAIARGARTGAIGGTFVCGPKCGLVGGILGAGAGGWIGWNVTGPASGAMLSKKRGGRQGKDGREKDGSESRPNNCPTGTIPIDVAKDKLDLDRDDIHKIKKGVGADADTWTGIDPDGNVWTGGIDGIGSRGGHYTDYLPRG